MAVLLINWNICPQEKHGKRRFRILYSSPRNVWEDYEKGTVSAKDT